MIIVGFLSIAILGRMTYMIARVVSIDVVIESTQWMVGLVFLSLVLTAGGGISAFRKKHWWWALAGAICSVFIGFAMLIYPVFGLIFPPMAILALIFLIKRKREFE